MAFHGNGRTMGLCSRERRQREHRGSTRGEVMMMMMCVCVCLWDCVDVASGGHPSASGHRAKDSRCSCVLGLRMIFFEKF